MIYRFAYPAMQDIIHIPTALNFIIVTMDSPQSRIAGQELFTAVVFKYAFGLISPTVFHVLRQPQLIHHPTPVQPIHHFAYHAPPGIILIQIVPSFIIVTMG